MKRDKLGDPRAERGGEALAAGPLGEVERGEQGVAGLLGPAQLGEDPPVDEVRLGAERGDAVRSRRPGRRRRPGVRPSGSDRELGRPGALDRLAHTSTGGVVGLDRAGLAEQHAAVAVLDARQRPRRSKAPASVSASTRASSSIAAPTRHATLIEAGHVELVEPAVLRAVDVGRVAGLLAGVGPCAEIVDEGAVDGREAGRGVGEASSR